MLSLKPRPFVQSFFDVQAPRQPHVFLPFFLLFYLEVSLFPSIFVPLPFSHCMENRVLLNITVVRFFLSDGVFPPCDHGLDFFTSAYVKIQLRNQSIRILLVMLLLVSVYPVFLWFDLI